MAARAWTDTAAEDIKVLGALFTGVRPIEVDDMEEIITSIIRTNIIAAEAAFEMNPTENMDKWCDTYCYSGTTKSHSDVEKAQK